MEKFSVVRGTSRENRIKAVGQCGMSDDEEGKAVGVSFKGFPMSRHASFVGGEREAG